MSFGPGASNACAVSPAAGTNIPPFPVPGRAFCAPVYGYSVLYGAAPGWTELKGQLLCRFSFEPCILLRSKEESTPSISATKGNARVDPEASKNVKVTECMMIGGFVIVVCSFTLILT